MKFFDVNQYKRVFAVVLSWANGHWSYGVLLLLGGLIAVGRLHNYWEPMDIDIAQYSVVAHEMLEGKRLYTDLFDQKPPLLYATYAGAQLVAGYGLGSVYLLGLVTALVTLVGVYVAGCQLGLGVRGGLWGAAFWTVINNDCLSFAARPTAEALVGAMFISALALLVRQNQRSGLSSRLAVGLLLCLGTLYKHNMVLVVPIVATGHVMFPPVAVSRRRAFLDVLCWALIGVGIWAAVFSYFALNQRFDDVADALFGFNKWYAGRTWQQGVVKTLLEKSYHGLTPPQSLSFLMPLFWLAVVGCALGLQANRRGWLLLLALALGYGVAITATGYYNQYYVIFLPVLAVGAGWGLATVGQFAITRARFVTEVVGAAVIVLLVGYELRFYQMPAREWAKLRYGMTIHEEAENLAPEINKLLRPKETFFVWGDMVSLFFYTQRPLPTRYHWPSCYIDTPLTNKAPDRVIADLERVQPPLLIICSWRAGAEAQSPVFLWLKEHYAEFPVNSYRGPFQFAVRKGSALEQRLRAASFGLSLHSPYGSVPP